MIRRLYNYLFGELAIDFGTANTSVYAKGEGILCQEPSLVALKNDAKTGKPTVLCLGMDAKMMLGRTSERIQVYKPVREGVISDFDSASAFLKELLRRVVGKGSIAKPRVLLGVPHGLTEVERRAAKTSLMVAGARDVQLIQSPLAAAIGAQMSVEEPTASLIMDIGAGTMEISVLSLGGIVYSKSIRTAGDKMDDAISSYIRRRYNLLIGERTAEQIKIALGSALPSGHAITMQVRGRDLLAGVPRAINITEDEVRGAISEQVNLITSLLRGALEKIPPELASDIAQDGLILTGGVSLLRGLDRKLTEESGIPVKVVENPFCSVVTGLGMMVEGVSLEVNKESVLSSSQAA
jgi:rod shape-determining protein MreB and related proteins